jgi:hypothetical protein
MERKGIYHPSDCEIYPGPSCLEDFITGTQVHEDSIRPEAGSRRPEVGSREQRIEL